MKPNLVLYMILSVFLYRALLRTDGVAAVRSGGPGDGDGLQLNSSLNRNK